MEEIDFGEIQKLLDEVLGDGMNFGDLVSEGMQGGSLFPGSVWGRFCRIFFWKNCWYKSSCGCTS